MSTADVFDMLKPLLVEAIPQAIATLKLCKPLWRVCIYYYDTHAPSTYLLLLPASAEWRAGVIERHQGDAPRYLWLFEEGAGNGPEVYFDGSGPITALFTQLYALLCEDEDQYMVRYREMLQCVCRDLNGKNWGAFCPVTDDFVIVPADGSMHFGDSYPDIANSIPPDRLQLLRTRGFGPPKAWSP